MTCTVCNHPQSAAIDAAVASGGLSLRNIAQQFGFEDHTALHRHKAHLSKRIVKAVERAGNKADDVFMDRHEHLFKEALQYVEDAKGAIKMQRVTIDGPGGPQERYQAFRDVGAMAPALGAATALQQQLGNATGRFAQGLAAGGINVNLQIVIPRAIEPGPAQVIECEPVKELADDRATIITPLLDSNTNK